ncbi:hypothetical protein AQJ30_15800 [Streptomyces longwoodensis]|uniref:Uncharacterized protein n=1 Tax=Streptomyces longwoodensis TaxID=68231 RepID=A0A101QXV4_9ACTN|nr:hypothetical protein [Streptomyces longwoodensis]KUN37746.1 hypothetical protein AQJ30_15800 [Streptomyces longwoodensis]
MTRDEEITAVRYMPATVVRITARREDGSLEHTWAQTYHLDEPLLLGLGTLETFPGYLRSSQAPPLVRGPAHRMAGALVARYEHPQHTDILVIAQAIWQRRQSDVAIEAWTADEPGHWWYALVPRWRRMWDTEMWPLATLSGGHHAYAVGECRPVDDYPWPSPAPIPGVLPPPAPGTQVIQAHTTVAPPPPGFPPYRWVVT